MQDETALVRTMTIRTPPVAILSAHCLALGAVECAAYGMELGNKVP
jgi:hypothetical protein